MTTGGVIVWDDKWHRHGNPLEVSRIVEGAWGKGVNSVAFSPDGDSLAFGYGGNVSDGGVVIWSVASHRRLGAPLAVPEGGAFSIAFNPATKTLAVGYLGIEGAGVALFETSARRIGQPLSVPEGGIDSVSYSPNGKLLIAQFYLAGD